MRSTTTRPLIVLVLALALAAAAGAAGSRIAALQAAQLPVRHDLVPPRIAAADSRDYVGREVLVEATVAQIVRAPAEGVTYVDLGAAFPHQSLRVVIPARLQGSIDPMVWYARAVRVRGRIEQARDRSLRIVCRDALQIAAVPRSR
jgi:hypothetical protein